MEVNERIKSNVSGRTYTVTWVSDKVTMAEVGFAKLIVKERLFS